MMPLRSSPAGVRAGACWFAWSADWGRSSGSPGCGLLSKCELATIKITFLPRLPPMTPPQKSFLMTCWPAVYTHSAAELRDTWCRYMRTLGEKHKTKQKNPSKRDACSSKGESRAHFHGSKSWSTVSQSQFHRSSSGSDLKGVVFRFSILHIWGLGICWRFESYY